MFDAAKLFARVAARKKAAQIFIKSLCPARTVPPSNRRLHLLKNRGTMERLLMHRLTPTRQYLYSTVVVVTTASVCFALSGIVGYRVAALILLFTVSLLAVLFDILPVLLAAALSALIWEFFFIPPR